MIENDESLVYYYCKKEDFENIIKSKSLWLTRIIDSNDSEEIKRTLRIIWGKIKGDVIEALKVDGVNFESNIVMLEKELQTYSFSLDDGYNQLLCACLTENRDLAQNWNEYGDHGNGYALGFSHNLFCNIRNDVPFSSSLYESSIGYSKVYYEDNVLLKQLTETCIQAFKLECGYPTYLTVLKTLISYSAIIKNPTYKDEREIRIIYYVNDLCKEGKNVSEITKLEKSPIVHCALPWIKSDGLCALREIIIGRNSEATKDEVQKILNQNDINQSISIVESEYSYQQSKNRRGRLYDLL